MTAELCVVRKMYEKRLHNWTNLFEMRMCVFDVFMITIITIILLLLFDFYLFRYSANEKSEPFELNCFDGDIYVLNNLLAIELETKKKNQMDLLSCFWANALIHMYQRMEPAQASIRYVEIISTM